MLLNLHVKNFAIIDELEVDFASRLNVLTGETGAGKSVIIGSITIALGGKITKDMIRTGAEYALVELIFSVEDENDRKKLEEMDVAMEEDTLMISRKISKSRTINRMNGENVTVAMIRQAASLLIDIHGQNEQQSLLHKAKHLEILDRYARQAMQGKDAEFAKVYAEYKHLRQELAGNEMPEEERLREISFLQFSLEEIQNAQLIPGEEEELAQRYRRLSNATDSMQGLSEIYQLTSGQSGSVSEKLAEGIRILSKLSEYDGKLAEFYSQLSDIDSLVTDFNRDISAYMDEFDDGQEELAHVEKRLDLIRSIKAKYGATTKEVMQYADEISQKIERHQEYDAYRREQLARLASLEKRLAVLAEDVSSVRKTAAKQLEKDISQALIDLNFLQVLFSIQITKRQEYTAAGFDDVEFMISMNPGEALRPLGAAASGGELSRIMLAVKAVLADHDKISTMIFDEIDVGISGRTAQMVAEKLSWIGRKHQVICISHLAQIAAMADTQYLIEKANDTQHTHTEIRKLNQQEAVEELARILGGAEITDAVLASAEEMKQLAAQRKEKNNEAEPDKA
ncbi:MAG: DNA repair protein RecN [Clostridiaceae bacterium]|nr:DNA repair protein RecN [Clostridiaceae bacterium]